MTPEEEVEEALSGVWHTVDTQDETMLFVCLSEGFYPESGALLTLTCGEVMPYWKWRVSRRGRELCPKCGNNPSSWHPPYL